VNNPSKILIPEGLDAKILKINGLDCSKKKLGRFAGAFFDSYLRIAG
jgi:hypothetical protein